MSLIQFDDDVDIARRNRIVYRGIKDLQDWFTALEKVSICRYSCISPFLIFFDIFGFTCAMKHRFVELKIQALKTVVWRFSSDLQLWPANLIPTGSTKTFFHKTREISTYVLFPSAASPWSPPSTASASGAGSTWQLRRTSGLFRFFLFAHYNFPFISNSNFFLKKIRLCSKDAVFNVKEVTMGE